jgi:hypothetical protein
MANPGEETTIINVKSVSAAAWEKAKKAATKQGETLGEWLSRAITQVADREAEQPRELPPVKPSRPGTMPASEVSHMMQAMAALAAATGRPPPKAITARAYRLADDLFRSEMGLPPNPVRLSGLARRQSLLENGKASEEPAVPAASPEALLHWDTLKSRQSE